METLIVRLVRPHMQIQSCFDFVRRAPLFLILMSQLFKAQGLSMRIQDSKARLRLSAPGLVIMVNSYLDFVSVNIHQ